MISTRLPCSEPHRASGGRRRAGLATGARAGRLQRFESTALTARATSSDAPRARAATNQHRWAHSPRGSARSSSDSPFEATSPHRPVERTWAPSAAAALSNDERGPRRRLEEEVRDDRPYRAGASIAPLHEIPRPERGAPSISRADLRSSSRCASLELRKPFFERPNRLISILLERLQRHLAR